MELNAKEVRDGMNWLLWGGLAALLLVAFMVWADLFLARWDHEQRLGETLRELRSAQASLEAWVSDTRQTMPELYAPLQYEELPSTEKSSSHSGS